MLKPLPRGRAAWLAAGLALALSAPMSALASGEGTALRPEVEAFITEMVEKHNFDRGDLKRMFSGVHYQSGVIQAISAPATAKPWHEYRPLFVNAERIGGGVMFWDGNAHVLARAHRNYGVPKEIIVAVIGVESLYGKRTGVHRVLDALTTLAFDYPRRADFFRGELEQYLLLTREQGTDATRFKGSYAGAMGIPQFLPSSYRQYAVDFDGDGKPDLWHNAADAIGSVANYLKTHGWAPGKPVVARARVKGNAYQAVLEEGIQPQRRIDELRKLGVTPLEDVPGELAAALFQLETADGPEYWLGFNNFYVITRYNRSVHYVMSVIQLSEEIRALRQNNKNQKAFNAKDAKDY